MGVSNDALLVNFGLPGQFGVDNIGAIQEDLARKTLYATRELFTYFGNLKLVVLDLLKGSK